MKIDSAIETVGLGVGLHSGLLHEELYISPAYRVGRPDGGLSYCPIAALDKTARFAHGLAAEFQPFGGKLKVSRMSEWLQIVAALLAIVASLLRRTERKVVSALQSAGATSEIDAVSLPGLSRLGRWQFDRLKRCGAVVEVGDGRYYFNSGGYESFRAVRRRRAAVVVPALLVIILISWYFSR